MLAGAAEPAAAAFAQREFFDDVELCLHHRHDHQLRHALHRHQREWDLAAIPQRNEDLPLIIRVDQADQVAEHDAVLMPQTGSRQYHCGIAGIAEVYRDAGGDELALLGLYDHIVVYACAQIYPRRPRCRQARRAGK